MNNIIFIYAIGALLVAHALIESWGVYETGND